MELLTPKLFEKGFYMNPVTLPAKLFSVGGIFSAFWTFLGTNSTQIAALCTIVCTLLAVGGAIRRNRRERKR